MHADFRWTRMLEGTFFYCVSYCVEYAIFNRVLCQFRAETPFQRMVQPLYNTVYYNTVLDITRLKDGFQKCVDYIEKWPLMVIFQYNLYIFVWI